MKRSFSLLLGALVASGCTTDFVDTTDVVDGPRLLAVQTVPAEAAPMKPFTLTPLYVGPDGELDASSLDWASCLLQKPLGEPGPINPACFVETSTDLVPLTANADGTIGATMDTDACELFGPETPPPKVGQPNARPTDPDSTGGFYFPVRVRAPDDTGNPWSVSLERVTCQPNGLTSDVFTAFESQYLPNANPTVAALVEAGGDPTQPITASAGQKISLQVTWPDCSQVPAGATCGGAESYVAIDPTSKQLVPRRESMVASWFTTAGQFDVSRVGRDEADPTTSATNGWTAPTTAGTVHLWVVLRDSRGGTGWGSYTVTVQ